MIGLKMLNKNMSAEYGNMVYEIGKEYEIKGELKICNNGFHFCDNFTDCLRYYYNMGGNKRLFKIDTLDGKVIKDEDKYCSSKIKILEEIKIDEKFLKEQLKDDKSIINIIRYQKLSEELIEWCMENIDNTFNDDIAVHQKMTEDFLEKHWKDAKWDWDYVATYQSLSEEFIERYLRDAKWDWDCITDSMRDILSEELKCKIKETHPEARIFKNRNRKKEF